MKTPDQTDPWEDEFRKRFEHFDAEPPADALARILMQANAPAPPPPAGRRWRKYGALALIGVLLSVVGILTLKQSPDQVALPQKPVPDAATSPPIAAGKGHAQGSVSQPAQTGELTESHTSLAGPAGKPADGTTGHKLLPDAEKKPVGSELTASVSRKPIAGSKTVLDEKSAVRLGKLFRSKSAGGAGGEVNISDQVVARSIKGIGDQQNKLTSTDAGSIETVAASGAAGVASPVDVVWRNPALAVSTLAGKGFAVHKQTTRLPGIEASASGEPAQSKPRQRPVWFVAVMPLYTFRQISPNTDDDVYVRQIKTDNGLSGDRVGWRMQAGGEWRLTKWASLRLGVNFGQFRQTVQYSVGAARPDSIISNLIDDQTLQLTPVTRDVVKTQTTNWQYAGISADAVWHLGAGKSWTYYATTGASVGGYIGPIRRFSGFYQGSFGIERPLANALWFRVEPTVQYGWNAVSDHKSLFLIRPYMYGLTFGLRY